MTETSDPTAGAHPPGPGTTAADVPPSAPPSPRVEVRGARTHNLKNVSLSIPRDALVVFTGISGSGKSSLAFGTLFAEAQRRYLESIAPYARRLIDQAGAPEVDAIDGLPPAVALQQQRGTPQVRSSVGSVTTLASLIRLLYSRAGRYPPRQAMLYAEDFSPNTPQGACPACSGLGQIHEVDAATLVPDDRLTIRARAVAAWPHAWQGQNLRDILTSLDIDVDRPWKELSARQRRWILFTDEQPVVPVYPGLDRAAVRRARARGLAPDYQGTFTSASRYVLETFRTTQSALMKARVARFMRASVCPTCQGRRLTRAALSVTFAGLDISAFMGLSIDALHALLAPMARGVFSAAPAAQVRSRSAGSRARARRQSQGGSAHAGGGDVRRTPELSPEKRLAAERIAADLCGRLKTLQELGLGYLALERSTPTLSPGELQRLRLATQIRSQLFGVVYVLDEPSAGLHPADNDALIRALADLRRAGNSLLVVEHDLGLMRQADWLVDVGPGAGELGGEVLYSGPPAGLRTVSRSLTARYLFAAPVPAGAPRPIQDWLRLRQVTRNNLRGLDADVPLGALSVVTGVSGSGKSSLVSQVLVELVRAQLGMASEPEPGEEEGPARERPAPLGGTLAGGLHGITRLVVVDQKPIGRTPRSNLATYTGLFDGVRALFAATPLARARRYGAGRFSFNVAAGRCPTCDGDGVVSVELIFMPSTYAPCPTCQGARFNPKTLEVRYREHSIAAVLAMTVAQARAFFADHATLTRSLQVLEEMGLGYLRLGQPATELSGGEAQRIKLATELQRALRPGSLYVLDEPTTGLHPADVERMLAQLQALVAAGSTVVLVEHDLQVMAGADWLIDMGPGAGGDGGRIIASGTPQALSRDPHSRTAPYLRAYLAAAGGSAPSPGA